MVWWRNLDLPLRLQAIPRIEPSKGLAVWMHAKVVDAAIPVQVSESQGLVVQASAPAQVTLPVIHDPFRLVERRGLVSFPVGVAPHLDPPRVPLDREDIAEAVSVPIALWSCVVSDNGIVFLAKEMLTKWMLFLSRLTEMIFPCCPHSGGDIMFSNKVISPSRFTQR
jgi:hypothetical protein